MSTNNDNQSTPPHTSAAMPSSTPPPPPPPRGISADERERILRAIESRLPEAFALQMGGDDDAEDEGHGGRRRKRRRRPAVQRVQTVGFCVAQYWNDEADDAVHGQYHYSFDVEHDPKRLHDPERFQNDYEAADEDDGDEQNAERYSFDGIFLSVLPSFDSNGEMITAFAAFATESSQDEPEYTPYCLWHKNDDGSFRRTVVGAMRRPAWENRAAQQASAAAPTATPAGNVSGRAVIAVVGAVLIAMLLGVITARCAPSARSTQDARMREQGHQAPQEA